MTFDVNGDKKIHLYINGNEVTYSAQTAMSGTPENTSDHFTIGCSYGNTGWFNGIIDEVKIFSGVLSAHEVFDEYASCVLNARLDERQGAMAHDDCIVANNGTISGATWVDGKSGSALSFNGSSNSIEFGNPTGLNLVGSRSISAWIKPAQNDNYNIIAAKYTWGYSLFTSCGTLRAHVRGSTAAASSQSNETVATGEWQHVAMTFDVNGDKKIHLYINGNEVTYSTQTAMSGTPENTSDHFTIGCSYGNTDWFNGIIDEVKVFNKALNSNEISQFYSSY
jgi:hypothetical protein